MTVFFLLCFVDTDQSSSMTTIEEKHSVQQTTDADKVTSVETTLTEEISIDETTDAVLSTLNEQATSTIIEDSSAMPAFSTSIVRRLSM
ncbi:unnamed protein product [Adineta ricciae]|uniref:Uncharacterized protein n=1 Tax=Adineta ricciae TaxID=249248 RepID=A0A813QPK5_ADIRI|nr:unnamed protein product [Adineta ricciae]